MTICQRLGGTEDEGAGEAGGAGEVETRHGASGKQGDLGKKTFSVNVNIR
ncbi:MAG: hypothetical protein RH949_06365 [Coleofasciculus sp. A1-SPW-01]